MCIVGGYTTSRAKKTGEGMPMRRRLPDTTVPFGSLPSIRLSSHPRCYGTVHTQLENSLGELGEADGALVEGERGVDVLHERVAEEPHVAAEADVLARERADALARAGLRLAEAEAIKVHM